ncbi:hypothetical protein AVEN_217193-1 [Araneus ventricosus]|uniref:Uncharacterized protein n=1 Tax=Araneus ventricosus TaxID=182803 RepID=A0A4Y2WMD2_ARAVE|nr:hypothetical protein AVEN_217193-1 [Araneus ventricosus]
MARPLIFIYICNIEAFLSDKRIQYDNAEEKKCNYLVTITSDTVLRYGNIIYGASACQESQHGCLVILLSRFEATLGLFWDRSRNFEQRADDEDDALAGISLSKFLNHTTSPIPLSKEFHLIKSADEHKKAWFNNLLTNRQTVTKMGMGFQEQQEHLRYTDLGERP